MRNLSPEELKSSPIRIDNRPVRKYKEIEEE